MSDYECVLHTQLHSQARQCIQQVDGGILNVFPVVLQMYGQLPGNPTPPVTPGSGGSIYGTVGGKPACTGDAIDSCMTFPLPDGVVMPPFRLQHNLAVSNHVFHLDESIYQALAYRSVVLCSTDPSFRQGAFLP